ncbi:MAG: hypothetical protein ACM3YO_08505 [Bacteroidota bacterium]
MATEITIDQVKLGSGISFSPSNWNLISVTRTFVEAYCAVALDNTEIAYRISMAAHELLENAVKYSTEGTESVHCSFGIEPDHIWLLVENDASADHIQTLLDEFASINEGDPLQVYISKMERALTSEKSQLGFARIRWEGQADLSLETQGHHVAIRAIFAR